MVKIQRYMAVAGTAIFLALMSGVIALRRLSYDTGARGGAQGVVAAAGLLLILWVAAAIPMTLMRGRTTGTLYRTVLTVNFVTAAMLLWEVLTNR